MKKKLYLSLLFASFLFVPLQTHAATSFNAEYFNNSSLSGTPVLARTESEINNDWGAASPDPGIPIDQFSARWTGTINFEAGRYVFTATGDDGVRLSVDGQQIINQWKDQGPTQYQAAMDLTDGDHSIVFEYYENAGGATAKLSWILSPEETGTELKIMPLGDSISDGYDIPGAYRTDLKGLVSNINYVGTLQNGPAQLTDREHEGHLGWRIDEIQAQVVSWLQLQTPDMVLLKIGTNDVLGNHDLANAPQRLSNLIDSIAQTRPNADILVATILPINNVLHQQRADAFNAEIPGIVTQKRSQGKKVHYVDMHTALTYADLPDTIHPNSTGYTKMAQKWAQAIATVQSGNTPTIPSDPVDPEPIDPEPVDPGTGPFSAQYFNNMTLSGTPALTRNETVIDNNWGTGSPHQSVNQDFFSARWMTTQQIPAGTYSFTMTGDDGVRLYIDNQLVVDKWIDQGPTTYTANRSLDGEHTIKFEYYEKQGGATAKLFWDLIDAPSEPEPEVPEPETPIDIPLNNGFKAEYFNNMSLIGTPILTRFESTVDNDWGTGSPHQSVSTDIFSARWTGDHTFSPGTYRFTVTADDGVRLKLQNTTIIDKWKDQGPTTYTADVTVDGTTRITMEYYEKTGGATAKLSWIFLSTEEPEVPGETPNPEELNGQHLAEYFNNISLTGTPILTRIESVINNNWGLGSPHQTVNSDNFSARWTTVENFSANTYRFTVTADDGVRLKIDGQTVIDKWIDQGSTSYSIDKAMTAGEHTIIMEYYEKGWGAVAKLHIEQLSSPAIPEEPETPTISDEFAISFFNNTSLTGTAVYSLTSPTINYNWILGSPHATINNDNFSARATKTSTYSAGTYRFSVTADDGIRVKVNGSTIIDKWIDQGPTTYTHDLTLPAGNHTVVVEYYEKGLGAVFKFNEIKL